MAMPEPTYDLVLMLDTAADPDTRAKVLADVEQAISTRGTMVVTQDWGVRSTTYEIRHQGAAEYHLFQFHADRELLEHLHRTLRITDGVVRFRIIKLAHGTPPPPEVRRETAAAAASVAADSDAQVVEADGGESTAAEPDLEPVTSVGAPDA